MIASSAQQLTPYVLGHLGLVGAFIRETGIIDMIDSRIPKESNNCGHFTHGQVVALMILNGLGYTSRPIYMTHTYFKGKDVEDILGIEYRQEWFNDDVIDRTMDALYRYGLTPMFSDLALGIMKSLGRKVGSVNIDSTSFHYHGAEQKYHEDNSQVNYDEPHKINVTYGYSRDAHPELVQIMEQMMVDNATGIPLFMEPESGNTNDTNAFRRMVKVFEKFKEYTYDGYIYLCGDSALYSAENIAEIENSGIKYVTRAADGKLKSVQKFITEHSSDELTDIDEHNQGRIYTVDNGNITQKWLLVHSNTAEFRNKHSVDACAQRELDKLNKVIKGYSKTCYSCEPDAQKEIDKFTKKCSYCRIACSSVIKEEIPTRGRKPKAPKPDSEKQYRYKIDISIEIDRDYCEQVKRNKSFFVIATNDVERDWLPGELLKQYKSQNKVERGFRFMKDPEFFADSIFVSKNERIQTLLMIMTLSLAVFSGLEWKLRNAMKVTDTKLKNQVGKPTDKITMRYIFQLFHSIMTLIDKNTNKRMFFHMDEQMPKIVELLGPLYQRTYGT